MIYPSIRIEGAILSPDVLDRLDDLAGQRPADFGLEGTAKARTHHGRRACHRQLHAPAVISFTPCMGRVSIHE